MKRGRLGTEENQGTTGQRVLNYTILFLGVFIALYHMLSTFVLLQSSSKGYIVHLAMILLLVFLAKFRELKGGARGLAIVSIPVCLGILGYLYANADYFEGQASIFTTFDIVLAAVIVAIVLIAVWMYWGPIIPVITIIFIVYYLFGSFLPGPLRHVKFSPGYMASYMALGLNRGIWDMISVSANTIMYFMLFGAMAEAMGLTPSFLEIGKAMGRILRGGPAYMAWAGSSLVAMISGSGSGNVAITGTFTIPAMKKAGFPADEAGAIEAVVSGGGQITPPVMGSSAFIMAGLMGVSYFVIMQKAITGSVIFYITALISIIFFSYANKLPYIRDRINFMVILKRFPIFLIGLVVVTVMLMRHYEAATSCTYATIIMVFLGLITVPETRSVKHLARGLSQGAMWGASIGVVLVVVGVLATIVVSTGLAPKATTAIMSLTNKSLLPSLFIISIAAIILGGALPISAAYTLVALLMLPSLWALGIDKFASHFFALYFSAWASISPPEAASLMVASKISGGNFWRTGWRAMRLMIVPYVFPFVFVMHPKMIDIATFGITELLYALILIIVAVAVAAALYSWLFTRLDRNTRILAALTAALLFSFLLNMGGIYTLVIGLALAGLLAVVQLLRYRAIRRETSHGDVPATVGPQG